MSCFTEKNTNKCNDKGAINYPFQFIVFIYLTFKKIS